MGKNGWRFKEERIRELEKDNMLVKKETLSFKYYLSDKLVNGVILSVQGQSKFCTILPFFGINPSFNC